MYICSYRCSKANYCVFLGKKQTVVDLYVEKISCIVHVQKKHKTCNISRDPYINDK